MLGAIIVGVVLWIILGAVLIIDERRRSQRLTQNQNWKPCGGGWYMGDENDPNPVFYE